jgi:hypothetical protein
MLEDGQIGWILARDVTVIGDASTLPVAAADSPVYAAMQAFSLQTGASGVDCRDRLADGLLIQVPPDAEPVAIQINGVPIRMVATIFVQSQPQSALEIYVLEGRASITAQGQTLDVPAGIRYMLPMAHDNTPTGDLEIHPFAPDVLASLPLQLLPHLPDPLVASNDRVPQIIGVEECSIVAGRGEIFCPVYFINRDGDAISRMDVEFVYAPLGEWEGSTRENPQLLTGTTSSGVLGWGVSCSLAVGENFIGPIRWSMTISDENGHTSEPFEAIFNCVEGS